MANFDTQTRFEKNDRRFRGFAFRFFFIFIPVVLFFVFFFVFTGGFDVFAHNHDLHSAHSKHVALNHTNTNHQIEAGHHDHASHSDHYVRAL